MSTLLIAFLAGLATLCLGGGLMLVLQRRRQAQLVRARTLAAADGAGLPGAGQGAGFAGDGAGFPGDGGFAGSEAGPGADGAGTRAGSEAHTLVGTVDRVGRAVSRSGTSRQLAEQLARAGYHGAAAPAVYLGAKILLFAAGLMLSLPVALALDAPFPLRFFLVALLACGLSFVPNIVVSWKRGKRSLEVRNHLPDAVDMLEICVSAGMGLDAAWTAVTDEIRRVSTVFADEMELTNLEMSLGVPRAVAMRHMASRTGADDLSSLVALLVQSERFGAGIVEALTTFARSMRETRSQRAEETAEKLSVKLLFPMVLFIFPALLVVMVGPAVIELAAVLWTD